jgi:hypothetical protein
MSLENITVLVRMRDVGLALSAANQYEHPLSRIQLQKFIYLMDSLAGIFKLLPPSQGHYTFRHGPYDPAIQSAVDSLAFRGLAQITSLVRRGNGSIASVYSLSNSGVRWATTVRRHPVLSERNTVAEVVAEHVNRLGWDRIVPLVYAEPTYLTSRPEGYGKRLKPQRLLSNSSGYLLQLIQQALPPSKELITREVVAEYYFDYLDRYSRSVRQVAPEDANE